MLPGNFNASQSKPQPREPSTSTKITCVPSSRRSGEICGLKSREVLALCERLNQEPNPNTPHNWRELARKLHSDYRPAPEAFRNAKNPTIELLLHWDRYHKGNKLILREKLFEIGRKDCAMVIPLTSSMQISQAAAAKSGEWAC